MCDAWRTGPGILQVQTPERKALWGAMKPRMDGAQPDTSNLLDPDNDPDDDNGQDAVERRRAVEHADRKLRLSEAWKTPGRDPRAAATAIEAARRAVTHESGR
jgi:hypothetical protein